MGKGIRRRHASVPNLIRLSVQYDSVLSILRISLALTFFCVPSSNKGTLLWLRWMMRRHGKQFIPCKCTNNLYMRKRLNVDS